MTPIRLIIAGGGTGGHLFPGVAVAEAWRKRGNDAYVGFVGTKQGIEAKVLPNLGFPLYLITIGGLKGKSLREKFLGICTMPFALFQSLMLCKKLRPDVVLGVGGYASGPFVLGAWLLRIPTSIQEQNAYPGVTNRILGRFVQAIFLSFEASRAFFPAKKATLVGNPIRSNLLALQPPKANHRKTVFIFGGSQGARSINEAMLNALPLLKKENISIIHQTGNLDFEDVKDGYEAKGFDMSRVTILPFIQEMQNAYEVADLVVCRAGASTIAEITAIGRPSILIPYPYAAHHHQEKNAQTLVLAGAAEMILNHELDGEKLAERIISLLNDETKLRAMAENASKLGKPDAAERIVDLLLNHLLANKQKDIAHAA